jgi:hypothetical protein
LCSTDSELEEEESSSEELEGLESESPDSERG